MVYQVSPTHIIKVMQSEGYLKHLNWYKETLSNLQKLFEKRKHMFTYHHFYIHSDFETSDVKFVHNINQIYILYYVYK